MEARLQPHSELASSGWALGMETAQWVYVKCESLTLVNQNEPFLEEENKIP